MKSLTDSVWLYTVNSVWDSVECSVSNSVYTVVREVVWDSAIETFVLSSNKVFVPFIDEKFI